MAMTAEARKTGPDAGASRLAAVVFDRDEEPDPPLIAFLDAAAARGVRVAGLVQERAGDEDLCALRDVRVRDLVTGATLAIMQDLGRDATGCRVDPEAIAVAAGMLDRARAGDPDLLVVNRFGRLESEGDGMLAEIGRAFADDLALIVCVPKRYLAAWDAFAAGLDEKLPPTREAIEAWWAAVAPAASPDRAAAA
ncbi:uncharacterized protein DUF2478 [Roseiarcus fermentans]|uniref:Uncharacterized protein DUF2478 n=1 Tax=Roseiarcus fermentans TaxID=1473586 RepID=A0A366FA41_9HYPH|nr:DUF2478 domain-containing protein [Roseiarcus fermentans]RBP10585.1 uncharacterized protein DUF2478 [Roseiarcus fermentans]